RARRRRRQQRRRENDRRYSLPPHDLQNFASASFSVLQLAQIGRAAAVAGATAGAAPATIGAAAGAAADGASLSGSSRRSFSSFSIKPREAPPAHRPRLL